MLLVRSGHQLSVSLFLLVFLGALEAQLLAFQGETVPFQLVPTSQRTLSSQLHSHNHDTESDLITESRRSVLSKLGMISSVAFPFSAVAAPPMTAGEADGLGARAERALRPKPLKALRPKLAQKFAVLLMRSSYNALDQIDCIAMDQFQRDFFLTRQAEYQPFVDALGPGMVSQGDLMDPYYFDFISFAQYATISRAIAKDPPAVFEEQQPVEVGEGEPQKFVSTLIKRDPTLTNAMLASEHDRLVGAAILDKLEETFGDTDSRIPAITPGSKPDTETLLRSLSQIIKLFLVNGFAWDGVVSIRKPATGPGASGAEFSIELNTPATMWSGKALQLRRADPVNDFALKTVKAYLTKCGYSVGAFSVKYDGNKEISYVTVR